MKYKKRASRSFSAKSGEKALDTVEVDKSPTLTTPSTRDFAKNAYAKYGMWERFREKCLCKIWDVGYISILLDSILLAFRLFNGI